MSWIEKLALVIGAVIAMEAFAWAVHKYIMHGWGWGWHKSHHEPHDRKIEKNDLYAVTFSLIVIAMFVAGVEVEPLWWLAVGITIYGALYAIVHDVLVHHRFGPRWVPRHGYAKRLLQAHRLHHSIKGKDGGVSFGFLFAESPARLKRRIAERAHR
ncbi:sterol desaturase family protein [Sphingomonas sp. GM_Shp_2]|uniref:sterol desaturase family protein n=1 Tax=Sphingomonas sp. GM_Shp_2 TaxID=2937380 RepID=UPI002269AA49|nr:sterol desaturase family protein [Sphingomonas sp. GM_Shp_2]